MCKYQVESPRRGREERERDRDSMRERMTFERCAAADRATDQSGICLR